MVSRSTRAAEWKYLSLFVDVVRYCIICYTAWMNATRPTMKRRYTRLNFDTLMLRWWRSASNTPLWNSASCNYGSLTDRARHRQLRNVKWNNITSPNNDNGIKRFEWNIILHCELWWNITRVNYMSHVEFQTLSDCCNLLRLILAWSVETGETLSLNLLRIPIFR